MASISHPIPRAAHLRDQHGLVFSVWRKGKEIQKLATMGDQPQVEHTGDPRLWGSSSTNQSQKWGDQRGPYSPQASSHLERQWLCQSVWQHQGGKGSFEEASLQLG